MSEQTKKPFLNPYEDLDASAENQMTCYVAMCDKDLLRMIRTGAQGTFTTTLALLVKQLCHELRTKGITEPHQREQYERFVTNMRIVDATEYECLVLADAMRVQREASAGTLSSSVSGEQLLNRSVGRPAGLPTGPNVGGPTALEDNRVATRQTKQPKLAGKVKRSKG